MALHLFVNRERENLFLALQILARPRSSVMAFIPDPFLLTFEAKIGTLFNSFTSTDQNVREGVLKHFRCCTEKSCLETRIFHHMIDRIH